MRKIHEIVGEQLSKQREAERAEKAQRAKDEEDIKHLEPIIIDALYDRKSREYAKLESIPIHIFKHGTTLYNSIDISVVRKFRFFGKRILMMGHDCVKDEYQENLRDVDRHFFAEALRELAEQNIRR